MNIKQQLINKLFRKFKVDEQTIKNNLLKVMDTVVLETSSKEEKVTLTIKYERK